MISGVGQDFFWVGGGGHAHNFYKVVVWERAWCVCVCLCVVGQSRKNQLSNRTGRENLSKFEGCLFT